MARHGANQNVMSANGDRHFGADGWPNAPFYFTNDQNPGNFFRADGSPAGGQASIPPEQYSAPYVIQISNASNAAVDQFTIWQANTYLGQYGNWSNGNYTANGITVSSQVGNTSVVTYQTVLQQSLTSPFTVGKMYLTSIAGSTAQLFTPLSLSTYDASGKSAQIPILSPLSPNQYQSSVFINTTPFRVDQFTGLTLNIFPSAVFQIWFYPSYTINLARGLDPNQPIGAAYQNTPIQQPAIAVLKG